MTPWLVVAALVAASGAVVALAIEEPRGALVGLAAALLGAALIADPLPGLAVLGARLAAALLVVAMLRAASPEPAARRSLEDHDERARTHLGWPATVLLGAAGAAAGLAVAASVPAFTPIGSASGPSSIGEGGWLGAASLAFGLGCGLIALALPAALTDRLGPRRAAAAVLLAQAAILLRVGLGGPAGLAEEIVLGTLLIAVGAAAALHVGAGQVVVPDRGAPSVTPRS